MNIQISKNGKYTWLRVPCKEYEIQSALYELETTDTTVKLVSVDEYNEPLNVLVGKEYDIDHLNLLGRYVDGFCGSEYAQFLASVSYTGASELKDIVNLTQNIRNYTLVEPDDSLKTIGRNHYLNLHVSYPIADEESLNFPKIGRDLLLSGKGVETPYGLVFENGLEMNEVFNGHNIPCYYDRDFTFNCRLSCGEDDEYIFLPCEKTELERALTRLGGDKQEFIVNIEDHNFGNSPNFTDLFVEGENADIFELNRLAEATARFTEDEAKKLVALWEYASEDENIELLPTLTALAKNIKDFEFVPEVRDFEQLGRYLIKDSYEWSYDPDLDVYYDYEKFGEDTLMKQDGLFLDCGYVGIKTDLQLSEILEQKNDEEMEMMM